MKGQGEGRPVTADQILALRPTLGYISLMYVLHVPAAGGPQLLSGELVMPLGRVMSLWGKVRHYVTWYDHFCVGAQQVIVVGFWYSLCLVARQGGFTK